MAEVFKAKSFGVEGFEKVIAIKRILPSMGEDPDFIDMFIDEAKIAGQLAHANICQIFELGRIEGAHFIAMEYIWGKDLLQISNRFRKLRQTMPIPMACFVMAKVCEGLDHAHRKRDPMGQKMNIVHRDCSPQNVLISYEGEVKLIDFGIAKAASRSSKTVAGVLKGKFGYMSPEQVRGLALDRRSDVFAVGTVLYECITGQRLFQCESDFSTLEKVRNVAIFPPSHYNKAIEPELERIVMKALARDPDERYQWAGELQRDLQQLLMQQERVFTAKQLGTWLKQAFAVELERERKLMEKYKRIGPDGQPREESSSARIAAAANAASASHASLLAGRGRSRSQTGEFDDGPTEVFGELTVDRDAEEDEEVLVSQSGRGARAREPSVPPPIPGAGDAPRPISEEPTVAKVVVHNRTPGKVPAPLLESSGTERIEALLSSSDEMASFGSTAAVTPLPSSTAVRSRRRKGILKDVGIGLGIAAAVLVIFAGVKVLFFGDDSGPRAAPAVAAGTIAVTVSDLKPAAVQLNGEPVGKVTGGDALKLGDLTPGTYEVRVQRSGVDDCVKTVELSADAIEIATCTFAQPAAEPAQLTLAGDLEGAVVFVDGQEISAQAAREPLMLSPRDAHEVLVKREGAEDVTFAVNLGPGDRASRTVPEPVAVVDEAAEKRRAARRAARALEREARSLTDTAFKATTKVSASRTDPDKTTKSTKTTKSASDDAPVPAEDDAKSTRPEEGYLIAWTTPWARVWIDGKDTGKTTPIAPRAKIPLSPGKHKVTFVVGTEKFSYPVVIEPGAVKKLRKELPLQTAQ